MKKKQPIQEKYNDTKHIWSNNRASKHMKSVW